MPNLDSKKRETILVSAFINGILNQKLSIALKTFSPPTLDEAYRLIKTELKCFSNNDEYNSGNVRI